MRKSTQKKLINLVILLIILFGIYVYERITGDELKIQYKIHNTEKSKSIYSENDNNLEIQFIDVGEADCILIKSNNKYVLIDGGNNADGAKLVTYFESLGIKTFNYVIGTHAHEDHIGGLDNIIKKFNVKHFFMPDLITTLKTYEDILDALDNKNIKYETPSINQKFKVGDSKFTVLSIGNNPENINNSSIVLKMTYKNTSYLFMADAEYDVEMNLLNSNFNLKSDVLKVGHHGGKDASNFKFLEEVNPKYAVISVGVNNDYGHPKDAILDKFKTLGIKVYRTDESGTIILKSDGNKIKFSTKKTDTNG